MLTLYYAKGSSALASHILLEEVSAEYTEHEVPIQAGAHTTEEYQAINPKMRVPALRTPHGVITENPAILTYVATLYPDAGMLPSDPFARAQVDALNAYLCATMHVAFAHKLRGARWADTDAARADMTAKVPENLADCAALLEAHFVTGPWALGDSYTTSDAYLALVPQWLAKGGVDMSPYPKLSAHRDASLQRPATARVMERHGLL